MDPITMNKLLSVADGIETLRVENELSLDTFHKIVKGEGKIKNLDRRVKDILRIFGESQWITHSKTDQNVLSLTQNYHSFIRSWDSGNHLLPMNQGLTNYPPYARFLDYLKYKEEIKIPQRQDKESRRELGRNLKDNYDITFVAFDTFQTWAVSVGHAYRSPFEEILYWGGEWDADQPSLECFKAACHESYMRTTKTSGYANLGRLAHLVCQELRISFQAFEMKMNQFVETFPGEITLAPATIRREISGNHQITTIRPRKEILSKRLSTKLWPNKRYRYNKRSESEWLEYRYLEDGMRVKGKLVKLIRWETFK